MKLYIVKPESLWGEEKGGAKRAAQLAVLESLGLKEEPFDQKVYCGAEDALALLNAGYCGPYARLEDAPRLVWSQDATPATMFNHKCGQLQPSSSLFDVRRLLLLEGPCTDVVQQAISDGWRVLAIQPQPTQRRPDYILGRNDLEIDRAERAVR